ncbi:MAG: hypothetical protein WDZ84_11270 [Rhodovibrionaceae bacterium]
MSLGLYEDRHRRRRKRRMTMVKFVFVLILFGVVAVFAYEMGAETFRREISSLTEELQGTRAALSEARDGETALRSERDAALQQAETWERRYTQDVPQGFSQVVQELVNARLEEGLSQERLRFLLRTAQEPDSCDENPETKRFVVQTPYTGGGNDSVSFNDSFLTVTATGQPAENASGNPEAWYDKDQPVKLTVTTVGGGETSEVEGLLPLQHSMVAGDREYRFTARPGDNRGFLNVTAVSCAYP